MRIITLTGIFTLLMAGLATAQSPVDSQAPLVHLSANYGLADGPAWNGDGELFFPDVKGEKLFRMNAESGKVTEHLAGLRISASYFKNGILYIADNGNGRIAKISGTQVEVLASFDATTKPPQKPNDLVVDRQGNIYVTLTGQNAVARVTPAGEVSMVVTDIVTSNGLILSPDESILYVAAYRPKEIWAYPISKEGVVGPGKKFATMDDGEALGADGMTIDSAGNVYCAGANDIWIWSPSGELLDKIVCPQRPINCTFGGDDLKTLYITGFGGLYSQKMTVAGAN